MISLTTGAKIQTFFLLRQKDSFGDFFSRNILQIFQQVHILMRSRKKVRNTASSTKMADRTYANLAFSTGQYRKKGTGLDFVLK